MLQTPTDWFQGLCPWRVQGRALAFLPFPGFSGPETDMRSSPSGRPAPEARPTKFTQHSVRVDRWFGTCLGRSSIAGLSFQLTPSAWIYDGARDHLEIDAPACYDRGAACRGHFRNSPVGSMACGLLVGENQRKRPRLLHKA
jgi:hypothetical protein